ncbi:MAG: alanine dehydrogenase [Muribaculaceae bacterium]|nr:alanine dehydrogenase [Muribaculaceae bacterium]MDE7081247.1 alanine dehydrogenase [Muribaculaceae bacterium]
MIIGIPKEIKNNENRVGATPAGVKELVKHGHTLYVQHTAGEGSGFSDEEYVAAGATILPTIEEVYAIAEMIIKVKEPIEPEYALVKPGQLLFTYFHFASDLPLTEAMMKARGTCIAYETVRDRQGTLPLLIPMSEVAGRMSVQEGARFLEKPQGGRGILLGGVPGVRPAKVLVLGAGVVGRNAALMAAGLGADVTITDISLPTLRHCAEFMPKNVKTLFSSQHNIEQELPDTDLVIGSVLIPGAKAPHLITKDMVKLLRPGSVMVDVAIDQGGCFETSHPTTHSEPTYVVDGVIQYAVANIPGAVPYTSTLALTNATLPYALRLADMGWREACKRDAGLADGVNMVDGKITFKAVAEAFDLPYTPLEL